MSPEIHAALVGGALAGATVVLGVALTEWSSRVRARRQAIEDATHRLSIVVPHVTIAFTARGASIERGPGSPWWRYNEEVIHLTAVVRRSARWPVRRARKIRDEVEDLAGRVFGAEMAADYDGVLLTTRQLVDVTTLGLTHAVFGRAGHLDERTRYYREHGPTERPELD